MHGYIVDRVYILRTTGARKPSVIIDPRTGNATLDGGFGASERVPRRRRHYSF